MKTTGKLIIFVFALLALAASAYAADDSPLFEAVKKGDKAAVEELLAKGADVNAKDKDGLTPLFIQVARGNKDFVELLLAKGADINAKNKNGYTPLFFAEEKDIAELLLAKGADVNPKINSGETPLHGAALDGKKDIAELLLAKGADINAKDKNGFTPLFYAKDKIIAEFFLAKGADVNARSTSGKTLLHFAVATGKKDLADLLEEYILKQARSNPREAVVQLTTQLKDNPDDNVTRRLIIKLASELKPAPTIPEEARKYFIEGTTIVETAERAQKGLAAQSFVEALKIAPWWGIAYNNLGVAQELAGKYDEAEQAFNFYLLSNPSEAEKREVQDRIYGLSAKRKLTGVK